jgi:polyhydroxybutyrate depolymerase
MSLVPAATAKQFLYACFCMMFGLVAAGLGGHGAISTAEAAETSQAVTISFEGRERSYRLYLPAGGNAQGRPLVVALHGGMSTGRGIEDQTGFDSLADRYGFAVAYPDGIGRGWNAGTCCGSPMKEKVDDVGFVRAVIADVKRRTAVDGTRIYGTGFSNGSMLLHRIACEAPDTFTAIAAVSGGPMIDRCDARKPIPTLLIQGRADPRIPWDGGVFQGSYRPSIKEIVGRFRERNGCSGAETVTYNADGVECRTLGSCSSGDEVSWCGLAGVGHQWAGGKTYLKMLLGPNNERFSASQKIWTFFSQYPKRS